MKHGTDVGPQESITVLFETSFHFDRETIVTMLCGDAYSPIFMSSTDNFCCTLCKRYTK